jgi:hypothetical protein
MLVVMGQSQAQVIQRAVEAVLVLLVLLVLVVQLQVMAVLE